MYCKCSRISTTTCLPKSRKKQGRARSDCFWRSSLIWVFTVCYPDKKFVNSSPEKQHFREMHSKFENIYWTLLTDFSGISLLGWALGGTNPSNLWINSLKLIWSGKPCLWIRTDSRISLPLTCARTNGTLIRMSSCLSFDISVGFLSSQRPPLAWGRMQWMKWHFVFLNVSMRES